MGNVRALKTKAPAVAKAPAVGAIVKPAPTCAACAAPRDVSTIARFFRECQADELVCDACRHELLAACEASRIPNKYGDAHVTHPDFRQWVSDEAAISTALEWLAGAYDDRLVLAGPAGVGKTTLGAALINADVYRWSRFTRALFVSAFDLAIARRNGRMGRGEVPIVKAALETALVLLDDLGSEPADFASTIAHIIHSRHADQRRTIITTGFTPAQISERYGAGIARRVYEGATVVNMTRAT